MRKSWAIILVSISVIAGLGYWMYLRFQPTPLPISEQDRNHLNLMPLPAQLTLRKEKFILEEGISISWDKPPSQILEKASQRLMDRLSKANGRKIPVAETPNFHIAIAEEGNPDYPLNVELESYTLNISRQSIHLHAQSPIGVLWAMESLIQLLQQEEGKFVFLGCEMFDKPRFPWRGLMLDVSRHWMPKEVILRTLDGMAAAKLNVFHWHLTDDQGFRVESKTFPKLHELGSEGNYYSQEDISEIIAYAQERGILIVPEFDIPGHSLSWLVGYPELAASPGPFSLPQKLGIADVAIDPSNENTYVFLDSFFEEMAALFPGPYIHIGGDEINAKAWEEKPQIKRFMDSQQLGDFHELQAYFNQRVFAILQKHGKRMVGWDEILSPELPNEEIVVQCWRSHGLLLEAAAQGYPSILSNGWYLDHKLPAAEHYEMDVELVEGGVSIEPDSIWETWELEMEVQGNTLPGQLTLFGEGENLRGIWGVMDRLNAFEEARLENGQLEFQMEIEFGKVKFLGNIENDSLRGTVRLAFIDFEVKGSKTGSHTLPGTLAPEIKQIPQLTPDMKTLILGGEACLWTEVVSSETVDARIWPRTAAIAEKLWSPKVLTQDTEDMYRRLDHFSSFLESLGLTHISYRMPLLAKIAPNSPDLASLAAFVDILEEAKYYQRQGEMIGKTRDTPLESLADAAAPESSTARKFNAQVDAFLSDTTRTAHKKEILRNLRSWEANHRPFTATISQNPGLAAYSRMSLYLTAVAKIGTKAVHALSQKGQLLPEEKAYNYEMLEGAEEKVEGAELAVVPAIRKLIDAAYSD